MEKKSFVIRKLEFNLGSSSIAFPLTSEGRSTRIFGLRIEEGESMSFKIKQLKTIAF